MNGEPTAADLSMVSTALGEQPPQPPASQPPTPQPAPAPQPPQPPQPQPVDPFAMFGQQVPQTEATPQPAPAPTQTQPPAPQSQPPVQPTEPFAPAPQPGTVVQPTQAPAQQPPQPQQTPPAQQPAQYQTFEQYLDEITGNIGSPPELPDPTKIDPNDEAGIKQFFDNLVNTAVERARQENARKEAIGVSERNLWESAFEKYDSIRSNRQLRDMVHSIRMGYFQRGVAITPTQAADKLLEAMGAQYRQGVADNQVHTTIQQVQPTGGGNNPVPTTLDSNANLLAVQAGGEGALAQILDAQFRAAGQ